MSRSATTAPFNPLVGRTFLHPALDYLAIGGGLSLLAGIGVWLAVDGRGIDSVLFPMMPLIILAANSAHFGASTVRLYTKPGAARALPFLTFVFPIVTLAVTIAMVVLPRSITMHYHALYVTWSPYHYCAQAYGLAVMYCYRSGLALDAADKRVMWWGCMAAFFLSLTGFPHVKGGLWWFLDYNAVSQNPGHFGPITAVRGALKIAAMAAPVIVAGWLFRSRRAFPPAIVLLIIGSNACWFTFFTEINGFLFATVSHGIQYLVIVCIFHVRDQMAEPGNRHGAGWHLAWFYGACLALGYVLIALVPRGMGLVGFGEVESLTMVLASVNLHHFIVDAYIWRLARDPNFRIVTGSLDPAARAA